MVLPPIASQKRFSSLASQKRFSSLASQKRFLSSLIPVMERGGCDASLLFIDDETLAVNKDATAVDVTRQHDRGVKLRVYDGHQYHEEGIGGWQPRLLRASARRLGRVTRRRDGVPLEEPAPAEADYVALGTTDPATIPIPEKLRRVTETHARLMAASERLINARVYYDEMRETKIFVSRTRKLSQVIGGCLTLLFPFVKGDDGNTRYHYESLFGHGWEATEIPDKRLRAAARFAERVASATKIAPGTYRCLLAPAVSGLLAHESFGHGMEADTIVKGRAKAGDYLGKRIAPTHVSIADGPLRPGKHGFFFFDDEGFPATTTLMIEKGVVNRPLTDAYWAARLGVPRSSNGRCESWDKKVYARMTNTYFEPGSSTKNELLARLKDGLYLHSSAGGMEDPKGWGIQIQGIVAEEVRNGKLTGKLYYEVGMTGYLPDVLNSIVGVSKSFAIPGNGRCGKGHHDWVRVSEGGPYLLIERVSLS